MLGHGTSHIIVFVVFPYTFIQITERSNGFVRVKFMRQQRRGCYTFTEEEESTHPVKDIQQHMNQPVLVAQGRAFLYKFELEELEILAKEFELK